MTHSWVKDNDCVKYPDSTWQKGVKARTRSLAYCVPFDLDLGDITLGFKAWVMDNNHVEYYQDQTLQ